MTNWGLRFRVFGTTLCLCLGTVTLTTAWAGDPAQGRDKAARCRTCHGIDGLARVPDAPHLAGESHVYLSSQLKAFRSGRREHEVMSVIAKQLSDEDIEDLAAWYSSIEISVILPGE